MNTGIRDILFSMRSLPIYPYVQTRLKRITIDVVLSIFGPAFEVVSWLAPELKAEIKGWEEGRRFSIGVIPRGPFITLEKRGDVIRYLGKGLRSPDVSMLFKNLDAALPVFMGLKGSFHVFAENGILVEGNLAHTMEVNRVVNIVNSYLFPGIVLKRVLKRTPRFTLGQVIIKAKVYGLLAPAVVRHIP
jgi:hypothetical protein